MYSVYSSTLWLCATIMMSSQTNATAFVGILTGDDSLAVFADGLLIGYNGGFWSAARWFTFSSETRVIAVSVYNLPGHVGGFLGVFSNGVATDSSWKCKETLITPDDGWERTNFNDSTWSRAYIRHDNSGPSGFIPVPGIPHSVHWISAGNHNAVRFICRRHFTEEEKLSNSTLIAIYALPNQTISLYLDGVFTARADDNLTVVKDQHELQAIHVEDPSVDADVYFLSSSSNGVRTNNKSWRCSNQYHEGWFLPNFSDTSWPRPGEHVEKTYFIAPDAKWIRYLLAKSNKIFCRSKITVVHSESDLPTVPSYNTPSSGLQTSGSSLVPQMTNFPTSSICSTATVVSPRPTKTTRTIVSTVVHVEQHSTDSPRKSGDEDSSSPKMNSLSTLPIVVIAVSGIVTVGLGFSCYIWRRRNSARKNNERKLQVKDETRDKWELKSNDVTIYEELGHGAFGKVCKGIMCMKTVQSVSHASSKTIGSSTVTVAVKMLQDNATPDQMNDFLEEIILMKAVGSHKNIVSLIGCCTKSTPNFLVVEFASKGDLLSYLRERRKMVKSSNMYYVNARENTSNTPGSLNKDCGGIYCGPGVNDVGQVNVAFSRADSSIDVTFKSVQSMDDGEQVKGEDEDSITPQDMMSFSWQIARGMQYLSAKGIVHRDLAARNVLVCDNKLVKVADFGLARSTLGENVYHMTGEHNKLPVKWMSPEAINDGIFTTKSDVWSYGVLLWEIATLGGFPYPGIKNRELMRLLRRGYRMEKPDTCSEEFYQMMRRCWADNPETRPTFTDLCREIEDWIQREIPYLDMDQLKEDQPYYDASTESLSSGESVDANTATDNLACDVNEVTSEFTKF